MRILYDHQMFALQRYGGITRVFVELARRLSAESECRVAWYRGYHQDAYDVSDFRPRLDRYLAFDRPPFGLRTWSRERINWHAFRLFSRAVWRPYDVYHPSFYDARVAAQPRARRLAVTVYDMIAERLLADQRKLQPVIEGKRRLVERADVVFVISDSTRRDAIELLGVEPERTRLAYPASDLGSVTPAALPPALSERPFVLYVGPRTKYKNFALLQSAFARDAWLRGNLRVVAVGGSGDFLVPERRALADDGLLDQFIHVDGNDALLAGLYRRAVALVYPSRYEGFGIPPLEAMQCGCPVICAPTTSLPEVVGDAALFFEQDTADDLAHQIRRIAENSILRATLIARGEAQARRFSWDSMARATLDGYRAIV